MAADAAAGICPWCGTQYRLPGWGREYACGACARQLRPSAARKGRPELSKAAAWVGGLVLAGVAGYGLVLRAGATPRRAQPAPRTVPAAPQVALTPEVRERLLEKARFLAEDLRRDPDHVELRASLADHYLRLAVLERDRRPEAARQWLTRAGGTLRPVQGRPETRPVSSRLRQWERLEWRAREPEFGMAVPAIASPGVISPGVPLLTPQAAPVGPPTLGGGYPGGPGASPGGSAATPGGATGATGGAAGAPAGAGRADGAGPSLMPPPRLILPRADNGGSTPTVLGTSAPPPLDLDRLRRDWQAAPEDVGVATAFGKALEDRAERLRLRYLRDHQEYLRAIRPTLNEAIQVYLAAAQQTPLRVQQAALYDLAGGCHGKLEEWDEEYRLLRRAVERAPYSAKLWDRLRVVCLRTDRVHESRAARKKAADWRLPVLALPSQ